MHRLTRRQMLLAAACGFGLLAPVATGRADTESPRVVLGGWARELAVGPRMDATNARLAGSVFIGQDLAGAVFDGCDLYHVTIHECDLSNASFRGVRFTGARISECDIRGADFTDAIINDIEPFPNYLPTRLAPAQFKSTLSYKLKDLSHCDIQGAGKGLHGKADYDFRGADLTGARLVAGDFTGADFTDARVDGITIHQAKIEFDQLASTHQFKLGVLNGATIPLAKGKWDLSGMSFYRTSFVWQNADAEFADTKIIACSFGRGAIMPKQLRQTWNFKHGYLPATSFRGCDLSRLDFSALNLTDSHFLECDLSETSFQDAVITGADFGRNSGFTADQIKSTWNYKHARMEGVRLPKHIADALTDQRALQ